MVEHTDEHAAAPLRLRLHARRRTGRLRCSQRLAASGWLTDPAKLLVAANLAKQVLAMRKRGDCLSRYSGNCGVRGAPAVADL